MPPAAKVPTDFPDRIRRLRGRFGLTQTRFAELMGVSFATVNRWENGASRPSALAWRQVLRAEEAGVEALGQPPGAPPLAAEDEADYGPDVTPPALDFTSDPEVVRVVAEAERLSYGHQFNPAFASEIALIEPLPHQRIAVYDFLLPQSRIRFLLADDPGAGKTIMSGLLIRELLSRRLVRRVLIVPPAGLVGNWKSEMSKLFHLPFNIVRGGDARAGNPFVGDGSDLVIVSVDTLAGDRAFARLQEADVEPYDIVFFDEAHKLSANRNADFTVDKTDRYRLAEALAGIRGDDARWNLSWAAHHLVLLTATPHMGREYPYYALWRLLEPELFGSIDAFNSFSPASRAKYFIRRSKEEMVRYDGTRIYPDRISDSLGCRLSAGERELYDRTTDYIKNYYNRAKILNRSAARLAMSVFQRRLTSSTYALTRSFERRLSKLDQLIESIRSGRLREEELEARQRKLSERVPDPLDAKTADEEEDDEFEQNEDEALGGVVAVSLTELQTEREQVRGLLELANSVYSQGEDAKFDQLLQIVRDPRFRGEKLLVFTEHKDTLDFLVRRLEGLGFTGQIAQIHGGMGVGEEADVARLSERQDHVEFFRRPADQGGATIMVCTDAAAEGINLQFCWLMVNYDIPWNPARLEQRMGRIHRFGQKHDPVHIINLVADPDYTREGRVLKTLLDKLEKIRKELGNDKVFDVIGRLFEGRTLAEYMERVLSEKAGDSARELDGKLTKEQVLAIQDRERRLFGDGGDVAKHLEKLRADLEFEALRRLMPGYVRRFVEKATPLMGIGMDGPLDGVFSLKAEKPLALDPLLPAIDAYPPEKRNRFSVEKPKDPTTSVFLHPGEPVFDKLRAWVCARFERPALRGGVFIDPYATAPYLFHLARIDVVRRADPTYPALAQEEVADSRLVAVRQDEGGALSVCPVEYLLLLKGAEGLPAEARRLAEAAPGALGSVRTFLRDSVAAPVVGGLRERLESTLDSRERQVAQGFDFQEADLAAARTRLADKARAGSAAAKAELGKVKVRQNELYRRREEALAVLRREPQLVEMADADFIAHAIVVPSARPEDRRSHDDQIELVAMRVATAYELAAGGVVTEVHTAEKARATGLMDFPGFDLLSRRADGQERDIEVKGRAGVGEVELSENEWARAATLRGRYWLYVVFECGSSRPRLITVQDPFKALMANAKGGVTIEADQILAQEGATT